MNNPLKEAEELFEKIKQAVKDDDDEVAHSYEDKLMLLGLKAAYVYHENTIDIIKLALASKELNFSRWCA